MRLTLTFVGGLVVGAAIWLLPPLLSDRTEPWDAYLWCYINALILLGIAAGLFLRRHFWLAILGLYGGQAAVMFGRSATGAERAPWWAGALLLAAFTAIALIAGGMVLLVRWLLHRIFSHKERSDFTTGANRGNGGKL